MSTREISTQSALNWPMNWGMNHALSGSLGAVLAEFIPLFKKELDAGFESRLAQSPIDKTTSFYVSNSEGDDSNDGTYAQPWKTLAKVQATLEDVGFIGDTVFYFRSGDEWQELVYLDAAAFEDVSFASYSNDDSPQKPLLNHFVHQYPSGGGGWALVSGNQYKRVEATEIAYVLDRADPYLGALYMAANVADCLATNNSYCWDSGELFVNLAGVDPDTVDLEACPDAFTASFVGSGIIIRGNGCRIDGLEGRGAGASRTGETTQNEAFKSMGVNGAYNAITNCKSYYGGTHAIALYSAGVGGNLTVDNCEAGLVRNRTDGATLFNSYATAGGCSMWVRDCAVSIAQIPSPDVTAGKVYGYFTHASGGDITDLIVYKSSIIGGGLGLGNDTGIAPSYYDSFKAQFISCTQLGCDDNHATLPTTSGTIYINCFLQVSASTKGTNAIVSDPWQGGMLNSVLSIDMAGKPSGTYALMNPPTIISTGFMVGGVLEFKNTTAAQMRWCYDFRLDASFVIANCVIQKTDNKSSNRVRIGHPSSALYQPTMTNNAYSGVETGVEGSGLDANAVIDDTKSFIDTDKVLNGDYESESVDSDLVGAGNADHGVNYDYYWRERSGVPSIGCVRG